ncbi:MAG: septum site-determining protein MinC [Pontibacterium sp.]
MNELCFQLKGSVVSVIVLELYRFDPERFSQQLDARIAQAPQLFRDSPIVISLDKLTEGAVPDLPRLIALCHQYQLHPMAFRAVPDVLRQAVRETGLAALPATSRADSELAEPSPGTAEVKTSPPEVLIKTVVEEKWIQRPSKVITRPVRSGQQVYAEGSDLIILSQVSEGAEVLADGDIHIYGTLRGRALAGVQGNTEAHIFCQNLSAELVSIAGNFMLSDALSTRHWQLPAHIYLESGDLCVTEL